MSYCVNCGVEVDKTAPCCPLCNTPVYNPKQPVDTKSAKPYPTVKGQVDPIKRTDTAILITVVLLSTSLACGLLNLLVFDLNAWSLYVIGFCMVLWLFFTPAILYSRLPIYFSVIIDGIAVMLYVGIIAYQYPGEGWYFDLAIPIIAVLTLFILIYLFFIRRINSSILARGVLVFSAAGLLNVWIEVLIHHHLDQRIVLSWSAVVLTCCLIIVVALLTILKKSRLREEVRRRMHL